MTELVQPGPGENISVIVVSYHTGGVLWACLASLLHHHGVAEIIVVNNGNPRETEEELTAWCKKHAQVKLLTGNGNIGFAAGCNLGASAASGKYLAFLNPDSVLLEEESLKQLATLTERAPAHLPALIGARIIDPEGGEQRGSRRNLLTPLTALSENLGLWHLNEYRFPRFNLHETELPQEPEVIPCISGACMVIRRADYEKLGGMDESYFLHVEDIDLCRRVMNAGGSVWFHPQVKILHHRSTSKVSSLFVEWQKTRSFLRYFWRHGTATGRFVQGVILLLCVIRFAVKAVIYLLTVAGRSVFDRIRRWMNKDDSTTEHSA